MKTHLKEILLCIGPLGAKPVVVVFLCVVGGEQIILGVVREVEARDVEGERGVGGEPGCGRDGRRGLRRRRHAALARRRPRAAAAPARAYPHLVPVAAASARARAPSCRLLALSSQHRTIQLGSRFQYRQLHHHTLPTPSRMSWDTSLSVDRYILLIIEVEVAAPEE